MLGNTPISDLVITVEVNAAVVRTSPRIPQLEERLSVLSELFAAAVAEIPTHQITVSEFVLTFSGRLKRLISNVGRTTDYLQLIKRIVLEFVAETDLKSYFEELGLKEEHFPAQEAFSSS